MPAPGGSSRPKAGATGLGGLLTVALIVVACGGSGPAIASLPTPGRLIWSDEFNGPAGTSPDPQFWGYAEGDGQGYGNHELEYYTASPSNASMDGRGNLVITARKASGLTCYYGPCLYTSARIFTKGKFSVKYGRIEARIKIPGGQGLWPAFWMLGDNIDQVGWPACGEIDVMENWGNQPQKVWGTIHGPGYSGSSGHGGTRNLGAPLADGFHVFAVDWAPDLIVWSIDGQPYFQARPSDVAPNRWVFDQPFFLLLNVAVGGDFGGKPDSSTVLPASMSVDYVRVYALPGTASSSTPPSS